MRYVGVVVGLIVLFSPWLHADVVTPVSVLATSEFGAVDVFGDGNLSDVFAIDLIDGGGLTDVDGTPDNVLDDVHDNDGSSLNGWHAGDFDAGIPGGLDNDGDPLTAPLVDDQILEFDLGRVYNLTNAHIWQQNQANLFGPAFSLSRGVDEFEMLVSPTTSDPFTSLGTFQLEFEEGAEPVPAQVVAIADGTIARRVRFDINSAFSELDNEFVGLSEVRFEGTPVPQTVTPVGVLATSEFGAVDVFGDGNLSDVFATDLIDGGGLSDVDGTPDNVLDDVHDNDGSSTNGWHAGDFDAGIPGGLDNDGDPLTPPAVDDQIVEFDLGGVYQLAQAYIWQQNQANLFGPAFSLSRGVEELEILVSDAASGDEFTSLGVFQLEFEEGVEEVPAQILELLSESNARRVRFNINSAFSEEDNEFVGLSEVRFTGFLVGDFDGSASLTDADIDALTREVMAGTNRAAFDLNGDGLVNTEDRLVWVNQLRFTFLGDSDLDGDFDSDDLINAFAAGGYADDIANNSTWSGGDWNGDGEFDSDDLVDAFATGAYNAGPRVAASAVPEPSSALLILIGALVLRRSRRRSADV